MNCWADAELMLTCRNTYFKLKTWWWAYMHLPNVILLSLLLHNDHSPEYWFICRGHNLWFSYSMSPYALIQFRNEITKMLYWTYSTVWQWILECQWTNSETDNWNFILNLFYCVALNVNEQIQKEIIVISNLFYCMVMNPGVSVNKFRKR